MQGYDAYSHVLGCSSRCAQKYGWGLDLIYQTGRQLQANDRT